VNRFADAFGTWTPAAVVFDCDGVLMDTESGWVQAQAETAAWMGVDWTDELRDVLVGRSGEEVMRRLAALGGREPEVVAEQLRVRSHAYRSVAGPMPGAVDVVTAVAEVRPVAVASNSWTEGLTDNLERGGFLPLVEDAVGVDRVANAKPSPDVYLEAVASLGVEPGSALAVEDSVTGATAARAAGLRVLAVPSIPGQHPEGDLSIGSLADPDVLEWIGGWPRSGTPRAAGGRGAAAARYVRGRLAGRALRH
jgi:HAD superfamily hydrolase (TIGR01509 family)